MFSLDHPVRSRQHVGRDRQADLLRGFKIDYQLKLGRLLDGQFGRLRPLEDFVDVSRGAAKRLEIVGGIGHETAAIDPSATFVH